VRFPSPAVCFPLPTVCYYEGYLIDLIEEKKGKTLPLGFTYNECQCQKFAVLTTRLLLQWRLDYQIITLFELHETKLPLIFNAKF
jgi:hypothetical protein